MTEKVWFITGASRGFGRIWTEAALARGDKVAATARQLASLDGLVERYGEAVLPLALDVTDSAQADHVIAQAHAHFGKLDVVVNNAGYALVSAIEEASEADVRAEFETNFFGAWRVIRAALPFLREQRHGHIVGVSSVAGIVAGPIVGFYHASKWAFEAMHESLAQEVKDFGINVTLLEPGAYATDFSSQASLKLAAGNDAYAALRARVFSSSGQIDFGDPRSTAQAVLEIVDSANPPLRLFLGTEGLPVARSAYAERLATWQAWEPVSSAAQGNSRRQDILL
ncbi:MULTISPECIES: SDR family NAD(P)-dependent oxidoreductase [Burkholderia]|uniref:SDR family NAD(P)-dependent oxidoreductase n=1 Tax=Burkholderia TaxID=32008 RepID=UPI002FE1C049